MAFLGIYSGPFLIRMRDLVGVDCRRHALRAGLGRPLWMPPAPHRFRHRTQKGRKPGGRSRTVPLRTDAPVVKVPGEHIENGASQFDPGTPGRHSSITSVGMRTPPPPGSLLPSFPPPPQGRSRWAHHPQTSLNLKEAGHVAVAAGVGGDAGTLILNSTPPALLAQSSSCALAPDQAARTKLPHQREQHNQSAAPGFIADIP